MGNYAKPRGTRDFLPLDAGKLQILEMILKEVVFHLMIFLVI